MAKTRFATTLWNIAGWLFRRISNAAYKTSILFDCFDTYTQDGSIKTLRDLRSHYRIRKAVRGFKLSQR